MEQLNQLNKGENVIMFVKYSSYNKSGICLSLKIETLSLTDFIKQYKYSELVPLKTNDAIIQLKNTDEIHVLTAVYNHEIGSFFFFNLIKNILSKSICLLYNEYHMLDEMNDYLMEKYDKGFIVSETNPNIGFLQLSESLIDPNSIFDWYNLWGHGFNAWIIEKNQMDLFKGVISNKASLD